MQREVSGRRAVCAGSVCVTCECGSCGTPEVPGTVPRVCRDGGILFSKAKVPEGREGESVGRLLLSAEKAPAEEANGARRWSGAGTNKGGAEGDVRTHHPLNS